MVSGARCSGTAVWDCICCCRSWEEAVNSQNNFKSHRQGEPNLNYHSIYTGALKLFKKGMNPLDATIELGANAEVIQKAYIDFLNLGAFGEVGGGYNDMIEYLPFLLRLYSSMRENGLGLQDATAALEYASDWKKAEAKIRATADAVVQLQSQKWALEKISSKPGENTSLTA